jgi:hypothetical protein
VKAVFEGEKFCADVAAFGAQTASVGASKLERCLPRFGAAVAEEDPVKAADLYEAEGEFGSMLVEEEVRGMDEAAALAMNCLFDGGVGVTERGDSDAAEEVKVVLTVFVAEIDTLPADKQVGVALIGLEK